MTVFRLTCLCYFPQLNCYTFVVMNKHKSSNWIIAHRGFWNKVSDQNTSLAIENAFHEGFSVETDIRERDNQLVISHDIPSLNSELPTLHLTSENRFAINLKSDGLLPLVQPFTEHLIESHSFVFDGSIPEMVRYHTAGIPHALRLSEYEKELPWRTSVVWVDAFEFDWWMDSPIILPLLKSTHLVFVSPELHGRDHRRAFDWFVSLRLATGAIFSVCTDYPLELLSLANE